MHTSGTLSVHVFPLYPRAHVHVVSPDAHVPPFLHFVGVQKSFVGAAVGEGVVGTCVGTGVGEGVVAHVFPEKPFKHVHEVSPIEQEPPFLHLVDVQNTDVGFTVGTGVGTDVGVLVFRAVGLAVGFLVGGQGVGDAVGTAVISLTQRNAMTAKPHCAAFMNCIVEDDYCNVIKSAYEAPPLVITPNCSGTEVVDK